VGTLNKLSPFPFQFLPNVPLFYSLIDSHKTFPHFSTYNVNGAQAPPAKESNRNELGRSVIQLRLKCKVLKLGLNIKNIIIR